MLHTHLFLHSKQFNDVLVVEFLQNLKLSHLDIERSQEAQVVEHFDGVQVACFLSENDHFEQVTLKLCTFCDQHQQQA